MIAPRGFGVAVAALLLAVPLVAGTAAAGGPAPAGIAPSAAATALPAAGSARSKALGRLGEEGLLLIPDATNDRVMAFDLATGDLVDANFIPADPTHLQEPVEAIVSPLGRSLLVSDSAADAVFEYDLATGVFLRIFAPAGGVDNEVLNSPRGMALRGGTLLVANGSPTNGNTVVEFDASGTLLGNFVAAGAGGLNSPWDAVQVSVTSGSLTAGQWLVSGSDSDVVHRYGSSGAPLTDFASIDTAPQQIEQLTSGHVLVANHSGAQEGVVELSPSAVVLGVYKPTSLSLFRGVHELPNGHILTATSTGVYEIDRAGIVIEAKITGVSARFITSVGAWTYDVELPAVTTRFDTEVVGGRQYLLGYRSGADTSGSVWVQDLATGAWSDTGVDMPTPVSNYTIAKLTDSGDAVGLFLFGGRISTGTRTTAVQAYYPASNTTATFPADPWPGTAGGATATPGGVAVVENQAWMWGGFSGSAVGDETWVFDPMAPAGSRWSAGPDLPFAATYQAAAVVDGRIYSIGGDTYPGSTLTPHASVLMLDPAHPAAGWQVRASIPTPSSGVAGCDESRAFGFDSGSSWELAGRIALAGCGQFGASPSQLSDSFLYDVARNTWESFPPLNRARRTQAGAFLEDGTGTGRIWVGGGYLPGGSDVGTATAEFFRVGRGLPFASDFETGSRNAWSDSGH